MITAKKRGRKPKPYLTSWHEPIAGLRHRKHDGRWILADGRAFTEHNERKAVDRFREMTGQTTAKTVYLNQAQAEYGAVLPMLIELPELWQIHLAREDADRRRTGAIPG
jgi:hypothetical protein